MNECEKCKKWTVHGKCCKRDSRKCTERGEEFQYDFNQARQKFHR